MWRGGRCHLIPNNFQMRICVFYLEHLNHFLHLMFMFSIFVQMWLDQSYIFEGLMPLLSTTRRMSTVWPVRRERRNVADGECWGRAVPEQSHAPRPHPPGGVRVQRQQRRQQQLPHPQPGQHLPGDKGEIVRHKSEAPTLLTQTRILS